MIDRINLKNYIQENDTVFQVVDELLEISHGHNDQMTNKLIELIDQSNCISIVSKLEMNANGYGELINWSNENDILLYADNDVLICLPKKDAEALNNFMTA